MDPARALRQIGFYLERSGEATYRVRAFRRAAAAVDALTAAELTERVRTQSLTEINGIGKATARIIDQAASGVEPEYLRQLRTEKFELHTRGRSVRQALRGDCHTHSDWSDGGSPIREMAETARELGHEWIVLTDHSPRLTIANGLSAERLRRQLDAVAAVNDVLAPFRVLTGIEVDIFPDGSLDQDPDLLAELDLVVASTHSKLAMAYEEMTERLCRAVRNPHVNVLGHCTGRRLTGRGRPPSTFDATAVFKTCRQHDVAVEINARPDRLDPPRGLLALASEIGCVFAVDSDAHAPGQLDWLNYGCERAEETALSPDRIINTRHIDGILAWTHRR